MSKCPECSREVPPDASCCPYCGAGLKIDVDALQAEIAEARHHEVTSGLIFLTGLVLLFGGVILGRLNYIQASLTPSSILTVDMTPFFLIIIGGMLMIYSSIRAIRWWRISSNLVKQLKLPKKE